MTTDKLSLSVLKLVSYIHSLSNFRILEEYEGNYGHMGATITDAILQAGLKYESVVKPRVRNVLQKYPQGNTTTGFLNLLTELGPNEVLQWKHPEKPARVLDLTKFLQAEFIETESDLHNWFLHEENVLRLKQVRGVKDKTADYLKILVGINTSAVDRHMYAFLADAGLLIKTYLEAKAILNATADQLGVGRANFDYSVWKYMSSKS
jgi:hypothetical protein